MILKDIYYSLWIHRARWRGLVKQQMDERNHECAISDIAGSTFERHLKMWHFWESMVYRPFQAQGAQSVSVIASVGR